VVTNATSARGAEIVEAVRLRHRNGYVTQVKGSYQPTGFLAVVIHIRHSVEIVYVTWQRFAAGVRTLPPCAKLTFRVEVPAWPRTEGREKLDSVLISELRNVCSARGVMRKMRCISRDQQSVSIHCRCTCQAHARSATSASMLSCPGQSSRWSQTR